MACSPRDEGSRRFRGWCRRSDVGIIATPTNATELGLAERARFEVADAASTDLSDTSFDAAMSHRTFCHRAHEDGLIVYSLSDQRTSWVQ